MRGQDFVVSEILRVAKEKNLEVGALSRQDFLNMSPVTWRDLQKLGGFSSIKYFTETQTGKPRFRDGYTIEGLRSQNNHARKVERIQNRGDYLSDKLLSGIQDIFKNNAPKLKAPKLTPSKYKTLKTRMLTLLWSDLHFGSDVDPREVIGSQFNWEIAARRMAKLCKQAVDWKPQYRKETTLQVVLNGDIIDGVVHLTESRIKELQEQIWGATAILAKSLDFLSQHFTKVSVLCLPGNHERATYRGTDRALSQRWNSFSHSIFMGLKIWFRSYPHVEFDIPMSGFGTYQTPGGHLVLASHGDVEPSTSNVGSSFNVSKTMNSVLKVQSAGIFDKKVEVVLFGHWHQPSMFMLPNGTTCIVNGNLVGTNSYAQNGMGIYNSVPAQVMFESVPGFPVGDFRVVQVRDADLDKSLDSIVSVPGIMSGGLVEF